jgi:DNA-binding transcriptional regulator LsrR (DeoR family)
MPKPENVEATKMAKKSNKNNASDERLTDLLERLGTVGLYLLTDMDHHSIARRLGMGTQRVTRILKGLKKNTK